MRTVSDIALQVEQAMRTLQKLPPVGPRGIQVKWPDYIRNYWELWKQYGSDVAYQDADRRFRVRPTPKQISDLDEVLSWRHLVPEETYIIILGRGSLFSWRRIAAMVGKAPNTCRERFRVGIVALTFYVNQEKSSCTDCTNSAISESKIEALSL